MGYRITYQSQKKGIHRRFSVRLPVLILVFFLTFLCLVQHRWPEGAAFLQKAGLSFPEVTAVAALNDMAEELRYGQSIHGAVSDFLGKLMP